MLITSIVLLFLNLSTAARTRELMFQAKQTSVQDKLQLVVSSFSGLDALTEETAEQVISVLGEPSVTRLIVTDAQARAIYDSLEEGSAKGKLVLLTETALALTGKNVFVCRYHTGTLESYAAMPVVFSGELAGSVYIMDYDTEQGQLIADLEMNILRSSIILEVAILVISVFFSIVSSGRMRTILTAMRLAREGEYTHPIKMHGTDEFATFSEEFDKLTARLQESEAAQRQFVSDASHELKTPLASIKLLSDSILQNEMGAGTMREFVADIGSEAERLNRMSQKLLMLTRREEGTQEHEVVDVADVVTRVFRMLVPLADDRRIDLTGSWKRGCTVLSIEDDVYQILFNLVENGIKYNDAGGSVHVTLERTEDDVRIAIEDTGFGIPAEAIGHVFERFYRVDKARSRQAGGSGLGLSIVRELVERNYGAISVTSEVGKGTRFEVDFPYFEVEEVDEHA